jgi:hypothetical protein
VILNHLVTGIYENQHVIHSQNNFGWRIQQYGVGWYIILTAKHVIYSHFCFPKSYQRATSTFKNCCIPGLYSNISNNTSALLASCVVYADLTVPSVYRTLQTLGAYGYAKFQFADARKDKLSPDTAANERQIHKTEMWELHIWRVRICNANNRPLLNYFT